MSVYGCMLFKVFLVMAINSSAPHLCYHICFTVKKFVVAVIFNDYWAVFGGMKKDSNYFQVLVY